MCYNNPFSWRSDIFIRLKDFNHAKFSCNFRFSGPLFLAAIKFVPLPHPLTFCKQWQSEVPVDEDKILKYPFNLIRLETV